VPVSLCSVIKGEAYFDFLIRGGAAAGEDDDFTGGGGGGVCGG